MQYAKAICSKSRAIQKLKTKMYLVLHTLHRQILFSIWTNTIVAPAFCCLVLHTWLGQAALWSIFSPTASARKFCHYWKKSIFDRQL